MIAIFHFQKMVAAFDTDAEKYLHALPIYFGLKITKLLKFLYESITDVNNPARQCSVILLYAFKSQVYIF